MQVSTPPPPPGPPCVPTHWLRPKRRLRSMSSSLITPNDVVFPWFQVLLVSPRLLLGTDDPKQHRHRFFPFAFLLV